MQKLLWITPEKAREFDFEATPDRKVIYKGEEIIVEKESN